MSTDKATSPDSLKSNLNCANPHELKVLDSELQSLRKSARVFVQQRNSNVYFLSDKTTVTQAVKLKLKSLEK